MSRKAATTLQRTSRSGRDLRASALRERAKPFLAEQVAIARPSGDVGLSLDQWLGFFKTSTGACRAMVWKSVVSLGVKVAESVWVPVLRIVPAGGL